MDTAEIQKQLFQQIKTRITDQTLLVDEIAKLLDISTDSVYRRMRGEKNITLDEIHKLCTHYHVSLDQLMGIETGALLFQGQFLSKKDFSYDKYLTNMMHTIAYYNSYKEKEFYYMCKDMPIFHNFNFREIAAFKWFFWLKTYFQYPEFAKAKFRFSDYPDELFALNQKIITLYNQLPCTEIWNIESMSIFLRQIEFYREGQVLESDEDAYILYDILGKIWDHLEMQASLGYKFNYGDPEKKPTAPFNMYFNEVLLGDNNMLIILDGVKMSLIAHTTINYMTTRDVKFNENMYNHIQTQMQRSTLISEVSEKERSRFFHITREKIQRRKERLRV